MYNMLKIESRIQRLEVWIMVSSWMRKSDFDKLKSRKEWRDIFALG